MSWIETVPYEEASEVLKKIYDENKAKFGRVINLVKVQSLRSETLARGRDLYRHLMSQSGGLRHRERVLIATVVSRFNGCHY
jgi:alkylhydroperoxidase family enzyme